jgi:hypothetical protein
MIDLLQSVQEAVFTKLSGAVGLTDLAPVFQHVPQDTQPPMVIIGNIDSENIGTKGEQLEEVTIEVISIYRGSGRAALLDIMHQVRVALDRQELTLAGVEFDTPDYVSASADGPAEDGTTYVGISTFTINAEPA